LVTSLRNLEPALSSLAKVGPDLDRVLATATVFPFTQYIVDRAFRGDYANLDVIVDLTIPRLKRTLLLGTRWGDEHAKLVPAPGDPWYLNYTYEPLSAPLMPPPGNTAPAPPLPGPAAGSAPVVAPPALAPIDVPDPTGGG
jgi:hypothetical protein